MPAHRHVIDARSISYDAHGRMVASPLIREGTFQANRFAFMSTGCGRTSALIDASQTIQYARQFRLDNASDPHTENPMMATKVLQRIGSALLITLGVGHLILMIIFQGPKMLDWVTQGLWAAVPLKVGTPSIEALQNAVVFWASIGSFAIPSILLGVLQWTHAGRGITPGSWLGWAVTVWFALLTLLLVPSPGILGVIAGILFLIATRQARPT